MPPHFREKIAPVDDNVNVRNASEKPVTIRGIFNLIVKIGHGSENVHFLVAEKLATAVILG